MRQAPRARASSRLTFRRGVPRWLAVAIGALILAVVYLIPVLGGLLLYGLALFGTGAAILALISRRRSRVYPSYEAYVRGSREA